MPLIAPDYNTAFTCDALGRLISSLLAEAHLARLLLNICGSEAPIAVSGF